MDITGKTWGATPAEQSSRYPCDGLMEAPYESWTRAVDVDAPPAMAFRWLRQLTVAPYSYDWLDFRGGKSPDELTPDLPALAVGQSFLVFDVTDFEEDAHITGVLPAQLAARHGQMAVTYAIGPRRSGCRLVVRVAVERRAALRHSVRRRFLALGDLVMMRKQLLSLKRLAERDAVAKSLSL